jgi:hypothetical protein
MPYQLVTAKGDPGAYQTLTEKYWRWIHEPNCDTISNRGYATFMRDNSIGGVDVPGDNVQAITRKVGTNIFLPVYHCHVCSTDPHPDGKECKTIPRCMETADDDLSKIQMMWAKISINNAPAVDITQNLKDHEVTLNDYKITVGYNNLNREPKYHLEPGNYDSVVRGTYILLKNFQEGKYVLNFGGIASNFKTRSEYTMHIIT